MLVSVTERTREIGIRMALGAGRRAVRIQFLVEASMISVFGGMLGILFVMVLLWIVQQFVDGIRIPIPTPAIVIAFLVSFLVGVVFGLIPAERASKLNPTEALRYE
jgi:putative ABC transport system permease protein